MSATYSECPFCRIVAREAPAQIVHSSDHVVAFRDAHPRAPTHILIVPKQHIESAAELGPEHADMLADLFVTAGHLARAERIDRTGWRLVTNVGTAAGQSVHHLHVHLLGGRSMSWPPG
ncbi:MAG TPA: histidine triad nucleotide-binding protein [Actinomycetota bacterium]|jgi:histidine triad (HIT) family protein